MEEMSFEARSSPFSQIVQHLNKTLLPFSPASAPRVGPVVAEGSRAPLQSGDTASHGLHHMGTERPPGHLFLS